MLTHALCGISGTIACTGMRWILFMRRILTFVALLSCLLSSPVWPLGSITFLMWQPSHPQLWNELIATFERETGIRVDREIGPNSSTASHALLAQKLKNRDPEPDVFMMDVIWPPEFASAGWVHALDDRFSKTDQADFFPGAIAACTFRGRIYGVPFWTSGGLLYYRKDLLAKYGFTPPRTWWELVDQAKVITRGERKTQPALRGYSGQFKQYEGLVCNMLEFILGNGGRLLQGRPATSTIVEPANLEAVEFVRSRLIGSVAPRGVLTYEEPESLHMFIQGHAVFHRNWPYAWEISNNPRKSRIAGNVDITVLPRFPGGRSVSTLGGWQFAISRFSRKKHLAWKFVRFMTSPRIQKLLAIRTSQPPGRRSVYKDPDVLKKNPHFAKFMKVFENAQPRPRLPLYPLYSDILQRFLHRALTFPRSPLSGPARSADRKVDELLELTREAEMGISREGSGHGR
jgi:multiple sugar transport system substrate-binding protein